MLQTAEKLPKINQVRVKEIHKAYAYIVQMNRVLVFRHVHFPEAGIQIPGGTVEANETYSQAALREAIEETGLKKLLLVRKLGVKEREEPIEKNGEPNRVFDHFFHLTTNESLVDETWQHAEPTPSDGSEPILFEFSWITLREARKVLVGNHARFLDSFNR